MTIYAALLAFGIMSLLMIAAGVLGIQYARLFHTGVLGYARDIGWIFLGVVFIAALSLSVLNGVNPNARISWLNMILLWGGLPISFYIFVASLVSLRNARHMAAKEQEEFAKTKRALMRWKETKGRLIDG